jgi:hypothetical protein
MIDSRGLGPLLLQLTVRLSFTAYYPDDFKNFTGNVLYSTSTAAKSQPIFYVYSQDSGLFVIIRGSAETADYDTDADVTEVENEYGHFHRGFLAAAEWVWPQILPFLIAHEGPIYFTGHSYGGSVAAILHVFAHHRLSGKTLSSYGYASVPALSEAAAAPIRETEYVFVNDVDIIPTLSIGNCYAYLHETLPLLAFLPDSWLIEYLRGLVAIYEIAGLIEPDLAAVADEAIPVWVHAIKEYEEGKKFWVRYVTGQVFQLKLGEPRPLADCVVDPAEKLNMLSVSDEAFEDHHCILYVEVIDEIPWF